MSFKRRLLTYECQGCGEFALSRRLYKHRIATDPQIRSKIASYTRERAVRRMPMTVIVETAEEPGATSTNVALIEDVLDAFPRSVGERLERSLVNLAIMSGVPGGPIDISARDYPLLYAEDDDVMDYLLEALQKEGFIEKAAEGGEPKWFKLTPEGWNRVAEIERARPGLDSDQVFVAMWFAHEVEEAWTKGIKPGIKDAGFDPLRINLKEHNEKICDVIIAEIRRSRFVVADVTGQRQGVYFEGGFAMGLGIPVIWTCREDEIDKCHFDTRQYNHVVWDDPEDLQKKLLRRIQATIPRPR